MLLDMYQVLLTVASGVVAGCGFGLTSGGGSVLAVPLLVYLVRLEAHKSVCVSMITFTLLAAIASARNLRHRQLNISAALVVGGAGIISAPLGAWLNHTISERTLLLLFSVIVVLVSARMLVGAPKACPQRSNVHGRYLLQAIIGTSAGTLAGLLGIGGGFVIVPSLVLICGFDVPTAIRTAFMSIALISASAAASHFATGQRVPAMLTGVFITGALVGLVFGTIIGEKLSANQMQRVFAILLLTISVAMLVHNLV